MTIQRRAFITLLGAAAAWPITARAQASRPVVGFLVSATREGYQQVIELVREGLKDAGFVEGQNLTIEYRFADERYERLPALAAELVRLRVAVLFATGSIVAAVAAKTATSTIPIVFATGSDPRMVKIFETTD